MADPHVLYPRRLAYRALRMALDHFHLEKMALQINPDDPSQALPGHEPGEVWFYEDFARGAGPVIAVVFLRGAFDAPHARVIVERIDRIIRRPHLVGFRPREVGIDRREGYPDVDMNIDLAEVVQVEGERMRTAKQRIPPPHSRPRRAPTAIRAFGSSR